ncbi:hypothetical protein LOAG_14802, partial [Loa loa]
RETSSVIFDHISESPRSQTIRVPEEQGHKTIPESSEIFHVSVVEGLPVQYYREIVKTAR